MAQSVSHNHYRKLIKWRGLHMVGWIILNEYFFKYNKMKGIRYIIDVEPSYRIDSAAG